MTGFAAGAASVDGVAPVSDDAPADRPDPRSDREVGTRLRRATWGTAPA